MSDPTDNAPPGRRTTRPSLPVQDDIMAGPDSGGGAAAPVSGAERSTPRGAAPTDVVNAALSDADAALAAADEALAADNNAPTVEEAVEVNVGDAQAAEANPQAAEAGPQVAEDDTQPDEGGIDSESPKASEDIARELPRRDFRDQRIQMLEEALTERETMLQDYIRAHKKAQTEFESFKSRMRAKEEGYADATRGKVVERMLDVYDNLQRSLEASRTADTLDDLRAGVELVARDFLQRLEELGLQRFDPIGQAFDPTSMEAVGVVPVAEDERNGTVVMTLKPGFRLKDREIRPAMVQVGRKF